MTTEPGHQARTAALRAARTKDSQLKRQRALEAVQALEAADAPVTAAAVAAAAGVSTWLRLPGVNAGVEEVAGLC